jgi:hypothetical protein
MVTGLRERGGGRKRKEREESSRFIFSLLKAKHGT